MQAPALPWASAVTLPALMAVSCVATVPLLPCLPSMSLPRDSGPYIRLGYLRRRQYDNAISVAARY